MISSNKNLFTIDELASLSGLPKRTIRYYASKGLIDKPQGATQSARYDNAHLEQIERIKQLQKEGYSLARIQSLQNQTQIRLMEKGETGAVFHKTEISVAAGIYLCFIHETCNIKEAGMKKLSEIVSNEIAKYIQKDGLGL